MSSLKDIMDVDVEPLESQAYRRSREAAQQQAFSPPSIAPPSQTTSPPEKHDDSNGNRPIKRRKSNRSSRSSHLTIESTTPAPSSRQPKDAAGESMDYQSGFQVAASAQAGVSSPQFSSTGSEHGMDRPVKYTPVTGRISRAKKGVPVHTCDLCRPVKTFTRAEHLRRHQLSHQKPAYPCNFENCERAFHRPDLLARHVQRHENQDGGPQELGDPRSRTSSVASDGLNHPMKMDTSSQQSMGSTGPSQDSPGNSVTPRASSANESHTPSNFDQLSGNFAAAKFTNSGNPLKRARSVALPESDTYNALSPRPAPVRSGSRSYDLPTSNGFSDPSQPRFNGLYTEGPTPEYHSYPATPQLHLLQIPEEPVMPGLSYTHESSPWCSSASSNASTQSGGSRNARYWSRGEDRTVSTATVSDWPVPMGVPQWSHTITTTPQDVSGSGFESIIDHYDGAYTTSPRTIPPSSRALLNVPTSVGFYHVEAAVGTPTLSTYKPFTQHSSASSSQFADTGLDVDRRKKPLVGSPHLGDLSINTVITYPSQTKDLDVYINSYFQHFHQFFPIIHRPTFDRNQDSLLIIAMAAIGTQYHATPEARIKGSELNESAAKEINLRLNWSTQTMQAIVLTEMFTRFRGRKMNVRLSRHFEELYSRLLNSPIHHQAQISNQDPGLPQPDSHSRWMEWIDIEARQRLLATCFMFDVHQSSYHEQARSKARREDANNELSLPCPESLWVANNSAEWDAEGSDYSTQLLHMVERDISPQGVLDRSPFTQTLLICSFAARLPKRQDFTYPNELIPTSPDVNIQNLATLFPTSPLAHIYLALYHTPLHDLLAVSGDTWVFRLKITPPSAFHAAQFRLKAWSSSLAAAQAAHHACRILSSALSAGHGKAPFASSFEELKAGTLCICDYWSLYISALICWAFGNRYQVATTTIPRNNSALALGAVDVDDSSSASTPTDESRPKALSYVDNMLALSVEDLLTKKASLFKGDTAGVIDAVRQRLELENVGNRSGLLVDAIGVLNKIRVGGKGNWF